MNEGTQNQASRSRMLATIRRHLAASEPFDRVRAESHEQHELETRAVRAPQSPLPEHAPVVAADEKPAASMTEEFHRALEAVSGSCTIVRDEAAAAEAVRQAIVSSTPARRADMLRVAASDSPLVRRVMLDVRRDSGAQDARPMEIVENVTSSELFACDVGITSAQWAITETGTLVLESDCERHRFASLIPPVHIAIVEAKQIRRTLSEVLQTMGERSRDELSRTVTFITGSSRTSDIELTLAIGVHGPAELHVIVIDGKTSAGGERL